MQLSPRYILAAALVVVGTGLTVATARRGETPPSVRAPVAVPDAVMPRESSEVVRDHAEGAVQQERTTISESALTPSVFEPPTQDYFEPERLVVVIGEGFAPHALTFRRAEIINPPYEQVGRLIDQYEALATAARRGDGAAARMLFLELRVCEHVAHDASHSGEGGLSEDTVARCEGVTPRQLNGYREWARLAAESGDYLGTQYWGLQQGMTPEAIEIFEAFWNAGNASALPALSGLHAKGAMTGEPDWVNAYAYHLIYLRLDEAIRAAGRSWQSAGYRIDTHLALSDHRRYLSGMLTPEQQKMAEARAYDLLVKNTRCRNGGF